MKRLDNRIGRIGFGCYCILMLWLLFGQRIGGQTEEGYLDQLRGNLNLIPFHTISNYVQVFRRTSSLWLLRHIVINLAGNVVMFVPLGFFLPLIWTRFRKFWKLMLWVVLIITVIELVQLVTLLGSLDVDDLILNVLGAAMGYVVWRTAGRQTG